MKTVSDLIKIEDIETWNNEDLVLIEAPTGRGKSHFVKKVLSKYLEDKGIKILYLVNRTIIKEQFEEELANDGITNIKIMTYQALAKKILSLKTAKLYEYNCIVADECHHFTDEADYIFDTDIAFNWILQQSVMKIFMTATSLYIKRYLEDNTKVDIINYQLEVNYDYIEHLYFYEQDKVIQKMLLNLPKDEKAIYFGSAKKAHELSLTLDSCVFYCSKNNYEYRSDSDDEIAEYIEKNEMFEQQVLATTKVMDCGVNIKDSAVKHVIVDIADLASLIQCIGRKRVLIGEKINIYIKNKKGNSIRRKIEEFDNKLKYAEILKEFGTVELVKQNVHKNTYGNLIYDIYDEENNTTIKTVNELMYSKFTYDKEVYEKMILDEDGFKKEVLERMGMNISDCESLEDIMDAITINDKLNNLVGRYLFPDDQKQLKELLVRECYTITQKDLRGVNTMKIRTVNSLIEDMKLPFVVISKQDNSRKSETYRKRFWVIEKTTIN